MKVLVRGKCRITARLPVSLYKAFRKWAKSQLLSESHGVELLIKREMEEVKRGK